MENECEAVVRLLIERDDVDINAKDKGGQTALILATKLGYEAVVRLLIGRDDIDINTKGQYGQTALMRAVKDKHMAVLQLHYCGYATRLLWLALYDYSV